MSFTIQAIDNRGVLSNIAMVIITVTPSAGGDGATAAVQVRALTNLA